MSRETTVVIGATLVALVVSLFIWTLFGIAQTNARNVQEARMSCIETRSVWLETQSCVPQFTLPQ
jgi:hypothetical protein